MAKVVIFSGAGVSAESGILTFRDSGGLWENYNIDDVCAAGCLQKDRKLVTGFYDMLRTGLSDKEPNYAHKRISDLKNRYPDDIAVITQNVDDMFERSGCSYVVHIHGFLTSLRCESYACDYRVDIGHTIQDADHQICPECQNHLRPDVVFFGDPAPRYSDLHNEMEDCELLVVIGTSGNVVDVSMLRRGIKYSILNNLEPSWSIKSKKFTKVLYKPATEAINEIIDWVGIFLAEGNLENV